MATIATPKRKHVGPGKVVISLYADASMRSAIKARANRLGIPVSTYIFKLATADIEAGGDFVIKESESKT